MLTQQDDFDAGTLPVLGRENAPNPAFLRRETLVLDGIWSLSVDGGPPEPVRVPFAPQSTVNRIRIPEGEARLLYRRTFELPAGWSGAVLRLEGADHEAVLRVNGVEVARHAGAYDPIAAFLGPETLGRGIAGGGTVLHSVEVELRDHSTCRTIPCGKQERVPREGHIFYGNMSGLWKSVWIERAGPRRIEGFRALADSRGRLRLEVDVAGAAEGQSVRLRLDHEGQGRVAEASAAVAGQRATFDLVLPEVRAWSPASPSLYDAELRLEDEAGLTLDRVETYLGFRDIAMRDGYYRLNGEPFLFQGLLNQAIYPDTLYTPTDRHTLTDFEVSRAQGFNGERRHQTTPRHRDLWLADRMGFWLSIEMPSARDLSRRADRDAALGEWRRILRAYAWNHPSVLFLVAGNEDWGLLEHPHHDVRSSHFDREEFQFELGLATEEAGPPDLPYAANDGWRVVTTRKWGRRQERLDPSRLMLNIHDYADTARLRSVYGPIPRFPSPGSWGENARHCFHANGYSYDGLTPVMMSEAGGRALLDRSERGVFAYGRVHRDPEAWAAELDGLIRLLGALPILRGGYVLTQTRDAGNDPEDPTSRGELNGILDGRGIPKYAGPRLREANAAARASWAAGLPAAARDPRAA
jgi:hypothetical protein